MKLYYGIPREQCEEAEECGLSIADMAASAVFPDGKEKMCIFTSLSPGDVIYEPESQVIVSLEIDPERIFAAEGVFRKEAVLAAQAGDEAMRQRFADLYAASFVPVREYSFGSYLRPECPVSFSFLPGTVKRYDEKRDFPVLCENAESLYVDCTFQTLCEKYDDLRLAAIRHYGELFCKTGDLEKIEGREHLIFVSRTDAAQKKLIIPCL